MPDCEWCGDPAPRQRKHLEHAFCSVECYGMWRASSRSEDVCKRCGVRRWQRGANSAFFIRGWCKKCYDLLTIFAFDESRAAIHELNQKLKGELRAKGQRTGDRSEAL